MSYLPQYKIGDCSIEGCNLTNTPGRKVGKSFICMNHYNNAKKKEQLQRANERTKIRSLNSSDANKNVIRSKDVELELWFIHRRKEMVGVCQCGCANRSQKNDPDFFKHSICHIFPKSKFVTIKTHPLNWVERAFWGGCHSIMDDTSMDRWINMADWENIKSKFYKLAPLLTQEEKENKFYSHLERLVSL